MKKTRVSFFNNKFHDAAGLIPVLLLILNLIPNPLSAQTSGAGSTSTNFQKIGVGARAVGMGEAFTAVADDPTAMYWNPAGLMLARGTEFNLTHGEWMMGVDSEFFAFSQNMERDGAFGGSINYLGGSFVGSLETASGDYGGVGDPFGASEYEGSVAYSQRLGNWFSNSGGVLQRLMLGLKVDLVGQNLVNQGSMGAALDAGCLFEVIKKTFYVGAAFTNIGTTFPATITSSPVTMTQNFAQPMNYVLGGSYRFKNLLMKNTRLILAAETNGYVDTGLKLNGGGEYKMTFGQNDLALRVGYRSGSDLGSLAGLTSGVGIAQRFNDTEADLDYAFVPYGVLGSTHRISLNFIIGVEPIVLKAALEPPDAFILGKQAADIQLRTRSEEPLEKWKLSIADASGVLVRTYSGKGYPPSHYIWDGMDKEGELVPRGQYSVKLDIGDDEGHEASSLPKNVTARWVAKKIPYQYGFQVSGDLLFDSGKDELMSRGFEKIQEVVRTIQRKYPESMILVAGHTDNVALVQGARFANNQVLSQARAQAVKDYLVQHGVDAKRLSVMGYGDTKPVATNDTLEGKAQNRRVELIVTGMKEANAEDMIKEGMPFLEKKAYKDALDRFLLAIGADSRNAQAFHLAGDCYLLMQNKEQAVAAYRKAYKYGDVGMKKWLDQYAPENQPSGLAPAAPIPTPSPIPPAKPAAILPQPNVKAPAALPALPAAQAQPAAQAAPSGMPQPVEGN